MLDCNPPPPLKPFVHSVMRVISACTSGNRSYSIHAALTMHLSDISPAHPLPSQIVKNLDISRRKILDISGEKIFIKKSGT